MAKLMTLISKFVNIFKMIEIRQKKTSITKRGFFIVEILFTIMRFSLL